jgi:hypothetical protein
MGLTRPRAYQIFDIDYKQSVRVVTVSNVTLGGGAPSTVDGVSLSLNDRILVTAQSTGSQNGLYYVTTVGTGSNGTWARSVDGNETGEIDAGMIVMVTEGTTYADTQWKLITNDPITIGSTALTFVQNYLANSISSGTSNVVVTANSNVSIAVAGSNSVVFSSGVQNITANIIPTANITYALGNTTNRFKDIWLANSSIYLGNVTISADATQLLVNGTDVVTSSGGTTSLTGNITGGNLITGGLVTATGNITGGNVVTPGTISATGNVYVGNILTNGYYYANGVVFGGGGGGTPGGANTQIQFNDNGAFNGTAGFTFNKTTNAIVATGAFSTTGNIDGGNLRTAGLISATGNITGGNLSGTNITGTLTTAAQTNITSVGTLSSLTVTANVQGGNLTTAGQISATGNITGGNISISGNAVITGNLSVSGTETIFNVANLSVNDKDIIVANNVTGGANVDGSGIQAGNPATATWFFNNATTSWQSNIGITPTANGTLSLGGASNYWGTAYLITASVTGNVQGGNLRTAGLISATGAITGAAITGSSLTVTTGNITGGNLLISGAIVDSAQLDIQTSAANANIVLTPNGTGNVNLTRLSASGNIAAGNLIATNLTGTLLTAAQTNVTSVGTLGSLTVTANIQGGNVLTGGLISATGTVTGSSFSGAGTGLTGTAASLTAGAATAPTFAGDSASAGNIVSRVATGFYENSAANTATGWPINSNSWQHLISSTHSNDANYYALQLAASFFEQGLYYRSTNGSGATAWSTVALHNTTPSFSGIVNSNANGIGNIGSSTTYFNTVFAKATSAQYADLAEMYCADQIYLPGTVLEFGGAQEVTATTTSHSTATAGIVSTNPSYLMNATLDCDTAVELALVGRVPCQVVGNIHKGDRLVSSNISGVATVLDMAQYQPGCIIG